MKKSWKITAIKNSKTYIFPKILSYNELKLYARNTFKNVSVFWNDDQWVSYFKQITPYNIEIMIII